MILNCLEETKLKKLDSYYISKTKKIPYRSGRFKIVYRHVLTDLTGIMPRCSQIADFLISICLNSYGFIVKRYPNL